jgi:hypothetical protein
MLNDLCNKKSKLALQGKLPAWLILLLCYSCAEHQEKKQVVQADLPIQQQATLPELHIRYHIAANHYKQFDSIYTMEQAAILLPLNRIDRSTLRRKDSLLIPDTFIFNWNIYSPFPQHLAILDSIDKILLFSYPVQAFAAYEKGTLAKWGPSSLGKKSTPTQTGLFHCNWKAKRTTSTVNDEWILDWYVNIDNKGGVSMHQYELPGYPASHACARLSEDDAKWVYEWIDQWKLSPNGQEVELYGTPVCIFGTYDFDKPLLRQLIKNREAFKVSRDTLDNVLRPLLPIIRQRQEDRRAYRAMEQENINVKETR